MGAKVVARNLRRRNSRIEKVGNRGRIFSIWRCIVVLFAEKSRKYGPFHRFRSRSIFAAQAPGVRLAVALFCIAALGASEPGREDWEEGRRLCGIEDYKRAQKSLERAVSKDPGNSTYHFWLGVAMGRRAEGMTGFGRFRAMGLAKKVKVQFERAVELDGSNLDALEALQNFHFNAPGIVGGNKGETRKLADRIRQFDEARGAIAWAACFEHDKDFTNAAEQYALARKFDPANTDYLAEHAAFLSRRRQHEESDELFDAAFERDPDNRKLWLTAAKSWIEAKRSPLYPRARKLLERFLENTRSVPNLDTPSQVRKLLKKL